MHADRAHGLAEQEQLVRAVEAGPLANLMREAIKRSSSEAINRSFGAIRPLAYLHVRLGGESFTLDRQAAWIEQLGGVARGVAAAHLQDGPRLGQQPLTCGEEVGRRAPW